MKLLAFTLCLALYACTHAQEKFYTGSTPAHAEIKNFLGIPLADSIDFIRWKFTPHSNKYELDCEYGIGKPNTNGFINRKCVTWSRTSSHFAKPRRSFRFPSCLGRVGAVQNRAHAVKRLLLT